MKIRIAKEQDYMQLAELKWLHCEEDEIDYDEKFLNGANKEVFVSEFINFLNEHKEYIVFVACENDKQQVRKINISGTERDFSIDMYIE